MPHPAPLADEGDIGRPVALTIEPYEARFGQVPLVAERDAVMEHSVRAVEDRRGAFPMFRRLGGRGCAPPKDPATHEQQPIANADSNIEERRDSRARHAGSKPPRVAARSLRSGPQTASQPAADRARM